MKVNGDKVIYTRGKDDEESDQSANPSIVLKLSAGDLVWVDPYYTSTVRGLYNNNTGGMTTWFNIVLLLYF